MKTNLRGSLTLLSVCVGLSVTARANTIDLQVELGAPGVKERARPEPAYVLINPTGFDGIPLGGQRISVNGDFAGNEFVRVYTGRPRSVIASWESTPLCVWKATSATAMTRRYLANFP